MVGREVILTVQKKPAQPGEEVLKVTDLHVKDVRGLESVRGVSFDVRAGEVLGIAGVQGNGQTELAEALTGLRPIESGHFTLSGKDLTGKPPRVITETGLANIPEDRQRHGLVLSYSVADNMMLCDYYQPRFSKGVVIQQNQVDANARELIEEYDVRTPSAFVNAGKLSGGNQQKVIVARELSRPVKLVVASQPTRGLDVGSIEYIHKEIIIMRDRGVGVLLISAELDEILSLSDRIVVMYRGQIVATVDRKDATREQLGLWMAGSTKQLEVLKRSAAGANPPAPAFCSGWDIHRNKGQYKYVLNDVKLMHHFEEKTMFKFARHIFILSILLALVLSSCNLPSRAPATDEPNAIFTQAALTVQAQLNQTATPSLFNTPTLPPPQPTNTAVTLPTLPPVTNTPVASPTPLCDLGQFVRDVTIPDGTSFTPGATFTKTWRIRNSGTCNWSGYSLVFDSGDAMNGTSPIAIGTVGPGRKSTSRST